MINYCPIIKEMCVGSTCVCWVESKEYDYVNGKGIVPPKPVENGKIVVHCKAFPTPIKLKTYKVVNEDA